jgi:hypothetical protein
MYIKERTQNITTHNTKHNSNLYLWNLPEINIFVVLIGLDFIINFLEMLLKILAP